MNTTDESSLLTALQKARGICKTIRNVLVAIMVVVAVGWLALVGAVIVGISSGQPAGIALVVYLLFYGVAVLLVASALIRMFSDVVKGDAPFTEKQASRLRLIAVIALLAVVAELAFTASVSYNLIPEVGYSIGINDAYPTDSINLNVGMLAFSAIMYSLSALFRYAALLQQLSDDTV